MDEDKFVQEAVMPLHHVQTAAGERPSWDEVYMGFALHLSLRSTCGRARVGCVVVTSDNHRVLSIGYNGSYRGGPNRCDSDQIGGCGCFPPNVKVWTSVGKKRIQEIKVGDEVLTHLGRFRRVTKTLSREKAPRIFSKIKIRGRGHPFVSTNDHPLLIKRGNDEPEWKRANQVLVGDFVLFRTKNCVTCQTLIPVFREMCGPCFKNSSKDDPFRIRASERMKRDNPMKKLYGSREIIDNDSVRNLVLKQKFGLVELREKLFLKAKQIEQETGHRAIIVDHIEQRPDIVIIDWENRKVKAFEYERNKHRANLEKYKTDNQYDDVIWFFENNVYDFKIWNGFALVRVERIDQEKRNSAIFNLEVEEDNSYVCQDTVVHNCVHAENNALVKLDYNDHARKKLYTTCSPCAMCAKLIVNARIDEVIYANEYRVRDGLDILAAAKIPARKFGI